MWKRLRVWNLCFVLSALFLNRNTEKADHITTFHQTWKENTQFLFSRCLLFFKSWSSDMIAAQTLAASYWHHSACSWSAPRPCHGGGLSDWAIIMKKFKHPNVMKLLGVTVHEEKPCIILPLMKMDLKKHLKQNVLVRLKYKPRQDWKHIVLL